MKNKASSKAANVNEGNSSNPVDKSDAVRSGLNNSDLNDELNNFNPDKPSLESVEHDNTVYNEHIEESVVKGSFLNSPKPADLSPNKSANASHLSKPPKDFWDKIASVAPIVSGILVFGAGAYFTYTYNQQQLRLMEVQTIEKFIPHLMGNEKSKKAAILALSFLTNTKIASKFASIFASSGTVSALKSLAQNGSKEDQVLANKALQQAMDDLAKKEDKLNQMEIKYKSIIDGKENTPKIDLTNNIASLESLVKQYENNNQLDTAFDVGKEVLNLKIKSFGAQSDKVAASYKELARIAQKLNKTDLANEFLNKATQIESNQANNDTSNSSDKNNNTNNDNLNHLDAKDVDKSNLDDASDATP